MPKLTVRVPVALTVFPKLSSRATVIIPDATPAVRFCGDVVNAKRLAAAGFDNLLLRGRGQAAR